MIFVSSRVTTLFFEAVRSIPVAYMPFRGFFTSISIFVFPAIAWSLIKNRRFADKAVVEEFVDGYYYLYVFFCIILYGCAINIAFIDMSHLASRLGRFSDYMAMCFLFPLYIRYKFGDNMLIILLLLFCVMAPFIYKGLYANLY